MQSGTVTTIREVILAAGSVHSPQILQLPGIGLKNVIEELGIEAQFDLPGLARTFRI